MHYTSRSLQLPRSPARQEVFRLSDPFYLKPVCPTISDMTCYRFECLVVPLPNQPMLTTQSAPTDSSVHRWQKGLRLVGPLHPCWQDLTSSMSRSLPARSLSISSGLCSAMPFLHCSKTIATTHTLPHFFTSLRLYSASRRSKTRTAMESSMLSGSCSCA